MRRYDIGESFWEDGLEIICVPAALDGDPRTPSCMGCVFAGREMLYCSHIACAAYERADGMLAHFWLVEDMDECAFRDMKEYMSKKSKTTTK